MKDKEETYSIEGKGYTGRANRHLIMIKREPEAIYKILTNPYQMKEWVPFEQIRVEKATVGEFDLGTRLRFRLNFRIQPEWDVEVVHLEKPKQIVNQFLNGIFGGGIEIWDLKKTDSGTEVAHTLVYKIHRWIYRIGWYLLGGERKHNELTELALSRLKALLEGGT
jgi:uncharacterized protein YndB with AHSA1/START domain